jgi:hypothetical protein
MVFLPAAEAFDIHAPETADAIGAIPASLRSLRREIWNIRVS